MTVEERLDQKFEELLEVRGESRCNLQEQALVAAGKVMDIFKYTMDGMKIQKVLMKEVKKDIFVFAAQDRDGTFRTCVLSNVLEEAGGYIAKNVKMAMLNLLRKHFDINPNAKNSIVISMKN